MGIPSRGIADVLLLRAFHSFTGSETMASHERLHTAGPAPATLDTALAILRVVLGIVFIAHGGQKLFWNGIAGTTEGFASMGVFLPSVTAPLVAIVEFFGGIALVLGFFTRLAALGVGTVMLGAMLIVHLPNGFFLPMGIEFTLVNLSVAVALALLGPGAYSLDARRAAGRRAAEASVATP